jgi:hypothetical protein
MRLKSGGLPRTGRPWRIFEDMLRMSAMPRRRGKTDFAGAFYFVFLIITQALLI